MTDTSNTPRFVRSAYPSAAIQELAEYLYSGDWDNADSDTDMAELEGRP